jgi:hypothetical protein
MSQPSSHSRTLEVVVGRRQLAGLALGAALALVAGRRASSGAAFRLAYDFRGLGPDAGHAVNCACPMCKQGPQGRALQA